MFRNGLFVCLLVPLLINLCVPVVLRIVCFAGINKMCRLFPVACLLQFLVVYHLWHNCWFVGYVSMSSCPLSDEACLTPTIYSDWDHRDK